jgi:diaminohydroxyphosphoribosylaminopyrimidine deaminase/5-amino-6-(5-phosphoribosylamino)uracil reductase
VKPSDRVFLDAAVELAEGGRFTCAPNPTVGCIIVRDAEIIGRGFHVMAGSGHAEVNAIADAGGDVRGSTVYVSLEPCAFEGRTPACAQTLIDAEVARVVIAAEDPHPRVSGAGINMLRSAGIEVNLLTQPEALACIAGYSCRVSDNRPFVRIKTASSVDGGTALASGESQWITGEAARADVQYWRARSDAIITGVGTVLADDPRLTVRPDVHGGAYADCLQPLRVILDSKLRTPSTATLLNDGGATLLVHNGDVEPPTYLRELPGVTLLGLDNGPQDLSAVLIHLSEAGCNEVLVEAGAQVCGSFAAAGLWDEWLCYVAPKWLGSGHRGLAEFTVPQLADAPTGEILQITEIGDDMRLRMVPGHG